MTTIYLIRHAEAEGNLYRRIHGWYDALVTENGLRADPGPGAALPGGALRRGVVQRPVPYLHHGPGCL